LQRVGFQRLSIGLDKVAFDQAGMSITLDGIAKGYIVDAAVAELEKHGFRQVMVDAGGDIGSSRRDDGSSWHIGIQDPRSSAGSSIAVTRLSGGALATSGDYLHAYTSDLSLNHILNPHSGRSPTELSSVSVIAPAAWLADALATGIMVLGSQAGLQLAERLGNIDCLLVTKSDRVIRSSGFPINS
jgi:thiamine biosynthesis lipoprotein